MVSKDRVCVCLSCVQCEVQLHPDRKLCGHVLHQLQNSLNFLNFWTQQGSPSILKRSSGLRYEQKLPMISDFLCGRSPATAAMQPRYASFSLQEELDAASGFEFLLALA